MEFDKDLLALMRATKKSSRSPRENIQRERDKSIKKQEADKKQDAEALAQPIGPPTGTRTKIEGPQWPRLSS